MKMIILMRTDLSMGKGKMIAQGAHAAVGMIRHLYPSLGVVNLKEASGLNLWEADGGKKVVLGVSSLEELTKYVALAKQARIHTYMVTDAAKTFFKEPTTTCAAIGPAPDDNIDIITGGLPLL